MSITLSPETQTQLEAIAAQRGLPLEDALAQVLAEARAAWEYEQQDTLAGLNRAHADIAAGRTYSLQNTLAGMDATLEAKRQQAQSQEDIAP